jgi:GDP/UDP-N,N'-diacetylbacillosamine 2-epimerase (hydrolysing)
VIKKIVVTTGTRADYGMLRPILLEIKKSKKFKLYLLVTGTHISKKYGMTINEIRKDGFKIHSIVDLNMKGDTTYHMTYALGYGVIRFAKIFRRVKPDINLVLGDRIEMLASTLAAAHMNIPNAHIHGGDKSGGIDEYDRHAITKMSNIHFAASEKSKERILKMGEDPNYVFLTGSPAIDEIVQNKITNKKNLEEKYKLRFVGDEILLVQHPVTTQSENSEKQILNTLKAIMKIKKPTIVIAPNSDAGNKKIFQRLKQYTKKYSFIKMYRSLPREDYLGILKNCGVLVGNSSSGLIEAIYLNTPVINIGIRQKNRESENNVSTVENENPEQIYRCIVKALEIKKKHKLKNKNLYGTGNSAKKIVRLLEKVNINKKLIEKQIDY